MKDKTLQISVPVIVIIIILFVITNVGYYLVTQNTLVKEASKRMDVVAEYVQHYVKQIQSDDERKKDIILSNMKLYSELIVKELGPNRNMIKQDLLLRLPEKYQMDSISIKNKQNQDDKSESIYTNELITYIYSDEDMDYNLIVTKENKWPIQENLNDHLLSLANSKINYYEGTRISYELALFENVQAKSFQELVGFGSYTKLKSEDISYINKAINGTTSYIDKSSGKNVEKYFMPIHVSEKTYVLCIVSDYDMMKKVMMDQVVFYIYAIAICSVLFLIFVMLLVKWVNRNKDRAVESVHVDYEKSMETIFLTIKQQRHDYNNTMATIQALVTMKNYDDLQLYIGELVEDTHEINSILNINCAPLVALIQLKHNYSSSNGIKFTHNIIDFTKIDNFKYRSNEFVRVIGNLIDNAIDATLEAKSKNQLLEPEVSVHGYLDKGWYVFEVRNNGCRIEHNHIDDLIEPYFTTKATGSGLGLSIVNQITNKNNGSLTFESSDELTIFRASFLVDI